MVNHHGSDVSVTSSSSSTSVSEDSDDNPKISHLTDLLNTTLEPSIEVTLSRERLDSACTYVQDKSCKPFLDNDGNNDGNGDDDDHGDGSPTIFQQEAMGPMSEEGKKPALYPGIQKNMEAIDAFLTQHQYQKPQVKVAIDTELEDIEDTFDAEDYERYLIANSGSPNAIQATLLYCIETDDVDLADTLLRDVGIEHILRHCYLLKAPKIEVKIEVKIEDDSPESKCDIEANIFWLACYYGSSLVLDVIAQDTLAYFIENDSDHSGTLFDGAINTDINDINRTSTVTNNSKRMQPISYNDVLSRAKSTLTSLLEKPISTGTYDTPLYTASERNNADVVRVLLSYGVDPNTPNDRGNTPALIAATRNNVESLKALKDGKNLVDWNKKNKKGMLPVLAASQCGNVEVLMFLSQGIEKVGYSSVDFRALDSCGFNGPLLAAKHGRVEVIKYFSEIHDPETANGVDINQESPDNETALHIAVRWGQFDVIRALLESEHCDVARKNNRDMTALHLAVRRNSIDAITEFVCSLPRDKMTLIDTKDKSGTTPLYHAAANGYLDVVKLLAPVSDLCILCQVHYYVERNQPALSAAATAGHTDIITLLLQCGADVNQTDDFGHTPLSLASKEGQFESVKLLVNNGADLHMRSSKSSKTAIQKARKYKHEEIVQYLESCGG